MPAIAALIFLEDSPVVQGPEVLEVLQGGAPDLETLLDVVPLASRIRSREQLSRNRGRIIDALRARRVPEPVAEKLMHGFNAIEGPIKTAIDVEKQSSGQKGR